MTRLCLSSPDELEGRISELKAGQTQVELERDQVKADTAAVTDERNKYSQIVADLEAQAVSVLRLYCCYCSCLMSAYMYAYEVQCEDECVNCFYPTVNKFLGRDNKDLWYCIVL